MFFPHAGGGELIVLPGLVVLESTGTLSAVTAVGRENDYCTV
jgi:hypothetical protein